MASFSVWLRKHATVSFSVCLDDKNGIIYLTWAPSANFFSFLFSFLYISPSCFPMHAATKAQAPTAIHHPRCPRLGQTRSLCNEGWSRARLHGSSSSLEDRVMRVELAQTTPEPDYDPWCWDPLRLAGLRPHP